MLPEVDKDWELLLRGISEFQSQLKPGDARILDCACLIQEVQARVLVNDEAHALYLLHHPDGVVKPEDIKDYRTRLKNRIQSLIKTS